MYSNRFLNNTKYYGTKINSVYRSTNFINNGLENRQSSIVNTDLLAPSPFLL